MSGSQLDDSDRESGAIATLPDDDRTQSAPAPDWWHRDHPVFTALTGFFAGLVAVAVLPAIFYGIVRAAFDERTAEAAFPFVLVFFAVPLMMLAFSHTRRFGRYLLFGMVVTLLVVFGVGTFVLWVLMRNAT